RAPTIPRRASLNAVGGGRKCDLSVPGVRSLDYRCRRNLAGNDWNSCVTLSPSYADWVLSSGRFRGEADVDGRMASSASVAGKPDRTLAGSTYSAAGPRRTARLPRVRLIGA